MFRTGVYKLKPLLRNRIKDIFGKSKNISISLLNELDIIQDEEQRENISEIILNRFNSDRNVLKRTYKNRYNEFDIFSLNRILEENFNNLSILDIAISDGRASIFFLKEAESRFGNFYYSGSDINIYYNIHKKNKKTNQFIVTDDLNRIIEIVVPPFVLNIARPEGAFYFLNNSIKLLLEKTMKRKLINGVLKYQEKIELIHRDYIKLINSNNQFAIKNYNLHNEISEKYHVIRAMNILHSGYFSQTQFNLIFQNIYAGLHTNGLLIEGSNEDPGSPVAGAIYQKKPEGFILISESDLKSRIKDKILSFNLSD